VNEVRWLCWLLRPIRHASAYAKALRRDKSGMKAGAGGNRAKAQSLPAGGGSAKGRRNNMLIDGDYAGGNIRVDRVEGDVVYLQQELRDTEGWWFYWNFRVRGAAGRRLTFAFTNGNPIGTRGPAVSLDGGLSWEWLGMAAVHESSFDYEFSENAGDVRFCVSIPYLEADLKRFLGRHERNQYLEVTELCRTRKGRSVERVRIGCINDVPRWRIVITARHHACEMIADYAMEGIFEAVLADTEEGNWFRENVEIMAVPFMDKDGVEDGDQGKNRKPRDHNRDYMGKSIHPTVNAMRELVPVWSEGVPLIAVDLHCPWIRDTHNEAIYMVGSADPVNWSKQCEFGKVLESVVEGELPYLTEDNLPFGEAWNNGANFDTGKSFTRWASELEGIILATAFEIPYANARESTVTAGNARVFGKSIAKAFRVYLSGD